MFRGRWLRSHPYRYPGYFSLPRMVLETILAALATLLTRWALHEIAKHGPWAKGSEAAPTATN
jgi:hypothetical protein